ncbi:DUF1186 domain-containing protein [Gammaproteobacteria bacterium]
MNPQEIFEALAIAGRGSFPRQTLIEAVEQREAMTPLLLDELRRQIDAHFEPANNTPGYWRHMFAFYLLGYFRDPAAYPLFVEAGALPGDTLLDATGDMVTEHYNRQLAGVCGGDLSGIKRLIEDPSVNEFVRSATLRALMVLFLNGELKREALVSYLRELLTGKLGEDPEFALVWTATIKLVIQIGAHEVIEEARRAFRLGLVEFPLEYFEKQMEAQRDQQLPYFSGHHETLLNHPVDELSHWNCFQPKEIRNTNRVLKIPEPPKPGRAGPKAGRNDPCPCGSGKKYKKCCGK